MVSTWWDKELHGTDSVVLRSPWYRPGGTKISMVSTRWDKDPHGIVPVGQGSPWLSRGPVVVKSWPNHGLSPGLVMNVLECRVVRQLPSAKYELQVANWAP